MLWTLKFRKPMGVHTTLIDAPDFATAEETGRFFCANQSGPGFRYITVEKAIAQTYEDMVRTQGRGVQVAPVTGTASGATIDTEVATLKAEIARLTAVPAGPPVPPVDPVLDLMAAGAGSSRKGAAKEPKPTSLGIAPAAPSGRIGQ
jgi:hypothetical protein